MRLIDADLLKQNCKITGEFDNHFQCVDLITLGQVIDNQPTLDEKEIIRKAFERVVERLEETEMKTEEKFHYLMDMREEHSLPCEYDKSDLSFERLQAFGEAIEIVKEECGINE